MARTQYSEETKARVLAELATGASIGAVAKQFGISKATIKSWRYRADMQVATRVQPNIGVRIAELLGTYIAESLETLAAQARAVRDPTWVKAQPAGEIASLHSAIADRAFRLVAALEPDGEPEPIAVVDSTARHLPE